MKTLISPLSLTTTGLVLGLIAFNISPSEAATWTRAITAFEDNYSNTVNPNVNNGSSNFLSTGQWNGVTGTGSNKTGNQIPYIGFDFQSIINEVKALSPTAFIKNVAAQVIFWQTNTNTSNPNNPTGTRTSPTLPRVNLQGFQVTGNFSESQAINPSNPPTLNPTILFASQIQQGKNTYQGSNLNTLMEQLLTNKIANPLNTSEFSLALKATSTQNVPASRIYPIDDFFSQNQSNQSVKPTLNLTFEVWDDASKIAGEPNFKVQGRAGASGMGNDSYEAAILTSPGDQLKAQQNWIWGNNQANNFELSCNPTTKLVTFTLFSNSNNQANQTLNYTANSCKDIDGLKIFSAAQLKSGAVDPNAAMEIIVDKAKQIGSTTFQSVTGLSAKAVAGSSSPLVQDAFFFTDTVAKGGLGFTQGAQTVQGRMIMSWPTGSNNPQTKAGQSHLQVQLIPLARLNDPRTNSVPSNSFSSSEPLNNEPQTVPEPTSVISLILLGTLGVRIKLRRI